MPSVSWKWWTRSALLGEELWQGLAGRNCLWGFAQISPYFFCPWDVPICSAFNPSPHPELCEWPGFALSSSYSSVGFPSMDSKTCSFLKSRTRGERGTCWGSRALIFIYAIREDTPWAQILQQYLLWLWKNMRTHQGGRDREWFFYDLWKKYEQQENCDAVFLFPDILFPTLENARRPQLFFGWPSLISAQMKFSTLI